MAVVLGLDAGPHVCRWSGRGCFILMGPLVLVPGLCLVLVQGVDLRGQLGAPVHVPVLVRAADACSPGHRERGRSWSARSSRG